MDAVLDVYTLEMLGAAMRKTDDDDGSSPLSPELRELCDRLQECEGRGDADRILRESSLN